MQNLLYDAPTPDRASQIREFLHLLWGGKWIIFGALLLTMAGAAAYTYSIDTKYRTSSLLMVDRDGNTSVLSDLNGGRSSFLQKDNSLRNELLILRQSRTIAKRVAEQLFEMGTHPDTGQPLQVLRDSKGSSLSQSAVTGRVKRMISASSTGESTNGLYISATGANPHETALIVNLYADEYIHRSREKSRANLKASRKFLEEQADTLREEVKSAERRLQEYMSREQAVSLDQETGRIVNRISNLESRRAELRIKLDMQRASVESLKQEVDTIKSQLAERISSTLDERLSSVQKEKAELDSRIETIERTNPTLSPGSRQYRNLQQLKARSNRLARQTDSLAALYVQESLSAGGRANGMGQANSGSGVGYVAEQRRTLAQKKIELNGMQARLDVLNERLRENRQSLKEIPSKSIRMAQLQRERRSTEKVYNFVQQKLQEARLAEQSEIGYAEVIRPAGPGRPIGPDVRGNLILGFVLGVGLGSGLVFLRDQLDTKIHRPEDLREYGHHVIGVVPSMNSLIETDFEGNEVVEVSGRSVHTTLAMLVSPMSPAAEAYRRIRTNLKFSRPDTGIRSLAVSSADQGAGKTTTCANLGLALASAGKKTVIVDADFRRPWLHQLFNRKPEPGLSKVLYEDSSRFSSFASDIDNLTILPAGTDVPNPAELLESDRMKQFIQRLETEFEYVLIDTPPVLLFSDMLGLAPHCDATLLIARAGHSDGPAFDHTVDRLREVDADVLGCVLNQFDASSSGIYGSGSSYYGYAYAYRRMDEYYENDDRASTATGIRSWWTG